MKGIQTGVFLADENSFTTYGCTIPHEPETFEQVKAMLPMVKMMATNMNNGQEPAIMGMVEKAMHQFAIIFALMSGQQKMETEFCRGLVLSEEARSLAMLFAGDVIGRFFGGAPAQTAQPQVQRLMSQQ
jgi:hypothetical protein